MLELSAEERSDLFDDENIDKTIFFGYLDSLPPPKFTQQTIISTNNVVDVVDRLINKGENLTKLDIYEEFCNLNSSSERQYLIARLQFKVCENIRKNLSDLSGK